MKLVANAEEIKDMSRKQKFIVSRRSKMQVGAKALQ